MEKESYKIRLQAICADEFGGNLAALAAHFSLKRQSIYNAMRKGDDLNATFRQIVDAVELGQKIFQKKFEKFGRVI